jgi:DivIVA domain-containing protein
VHTSAVVEDERPETSRRDSEPSPAAPEQRVHVGELRDRASAEVRDVSFPTAVRGYDRRAVDAYVKQVNTVIAELEVSRSPQAAVRHALDRVGEQTSGILQRARETAEEITAAANTEASETTARAKAEAEKLEASTRAEAEEILARSRSEAAERLQRVEEEIESLRERAENQMRQLDADTETIQAERGAVLDEIRQLAGRLEEIADQAVARFPRRQTSEPTKEELRAEGGGQIEAPKVADSDHPS